ncbi:MAG TPA: hypothetical protein VH478_00125 [Trebonia sp.]|nr:hypothetical protein [Trebonia sp.]
MLLIGPAGSGKTAVLDRLKSDHEFAAPIARLDFARKPDATPLQVMLDVASSLRPGVPRVGTIAFPLLSMGIIAITLDPDNAQSPAEQLDARLSGGISGKSLAGVAAQLGTLLPDPRQQAMASEVGTVLGWVVDGIKGRQRGQRLDWYSRNFDRGDGTRNGPLLELHERWRTAIADPDDDARRVARGDVWRALCAALLADLRAEFDHASWRHGLRTVNCVALLDNVDTAAGAEFVVALADCRGQLPDETDPLLVVAAQGSRPRHPQVGRPVEAADPRLEFAAWRDRARDPEALASPWYPVQLTELSRENVEKIVTSHVLGSAWQDAQFVHALTGGHSASAWELARVLGQPHASADVRDLVTAGVTDGLLRGLRPARLTDEQLDAMAVFGATLRPAPRAGRGAFKYLQWRNAAQLDISGLLLDLMWASEDAGGLAIRPMPRRLLSHWLARDPELWEAVHQGYLAHYRAAGDHESQQYHLLALTTTLAAGSVAPVAAYLDGQLDRRPAADWDRLLDAITAAPNRLWQACQERLAAGLDAGPDLRGHPRPVVLGAAGGGKRAERPDIVARLVAGLWLFKDPLLDPRQRLARLVGQAYQALADIAPGDTGVFDVRARHFLDIALKWEDGR